MEILPFRFNVSGGIIRKLGRESISNKNVAVLELIKNSFDSGASKIIVDFKDIETTNSKLVIQDDGLGMNYDDIQNKWMLIATPNKSKKTQEGERIIVGEKGIGRLSSERLGEKTILTTLPKNELMGYKILFDWKKYENKNVLVGDIINQGKKIPKKKNEHGTVIEIGLRDNWNDISELKSLIKDIYLIHPPNKSFKDFKISVPFKTKVKDVDKPRRTILDKAAYRLKVKLCGGNRVHYEFYDYDGKKKSDWINIDRKLSCGDISFELFFFYRRSKHYESRFGKHLTKQEMNKISNFLDEYSGIKLYRDNFRVKPFGEGGNDWIGLDPLSQNNPSMIPRNYQVFGMIHISKLKNPHIKDVTTREGINYNEAVREMVEFVRWTIDALWVDLRSQAEPEKKKARKKTKTIKAKKKSKTTFKAPALPAKEIEEKPLIEVRGKYPQIFYDALENEINMCYEHNHPNATFFLARKLIENLILDILMKKFPNNSNLWWSSSGYHLNLSPLIKNLNTNRKQFKPNAKSYIKKFDDLVDDFRNETNNSAHNLHDYLSDRSELEKFKIKDMVQLLINIYKNI